MWKISDKLIARGYWDKAGDGTDLPGGAGDEGSDAGAGEGGDAGAGEGGGAGESGDPGEGDKPAGEKPSDEVAKLLKEVMKRKDQLKTTQAELDKIKAQAAQFDGLDAEQVRKLVKEAQEAETRKLEEKGQFEAVKKQMVDAHSAEKQALLDQIKALQSQVGESAQLIDTLTIGHSFDSSDFIAKELTLTPTKARIIYGDYFDRENGQIVAYDKPRGANNRNTLVDGTGEPLPFEQAIKKLVDSDPDRDRLIRSKVRPGADSNSAPTGKPPEKKVEVRGADRIAAALTKGSGA